MRTTTFDAQITAVVFDDTGAIFALGDGSVRFEDGAFSAAHDGAILCAVAHPSGTDDKRGLQLPRGVQLINHGNEIEHIGLTTAEDEGRAFRNL